MAKEKVLVKPVEGVEPKLDDVDIDYLERGYSLPPFIKKLIAKFDPSMIEKKFSMDPPSWDKENGTIKFALRTNDEKTQLKIVLGMNGEGSKHTIKATNDGGINWYQLQYVHKSGEDEE